MFCPKCGHQTEKDSKYCENCGAALTLNRIIKPKPSFVVTVFASVLLAAFFMPWFSLLGIGISGYQIGRLGSEGNYVWVIPILAGATILISLSGVNNRVIGAITGIVPLLAIGYGTFKIAQEFGINAVGKAFEIAVEVFSIGTWLTLLSSIGLIISAFVGVVSINGNVNTSTISTTSTMKQNQALNQAIPYSGMLTCTNCDQQNQEDNRFCENCGKPLTVKSINKWD